MQSFVVVEIQDGTTTSPGPEKITSVCGSLVTTICATCFRKGTTPDQDSAKVQTLGCMGRGLLIKPNVSFVWHVICSAVAIELVARVPHRFPMAGPRAAA